MVLSCQKVRRRGEGRNDEQRWIEGEGGGGCRREAGTNENWGRQKGRQPHTDIEREGEWGANAQTDRDRATKRETGQKERERERGGGGGGDQISFPN